MSNLKWFSGGDDRSKRAEIIITELNFRTPKKTLKA